MTSESTNLGPTPDLQVEDDEMSEVCEPNEIGVISADVDVDGTASSTLQDLQDLQVDDEEKAEVCELSDLVVSSADGDGATSSTVEEAHTALEGGEEALQKVGEQQEDGPAKDAARRLEGKTDMETTAGAVQTTTSEKRNVLKFLPSRPPASGVVRSTFVPLSNDIEEVPQVGDLENEFNISPGDDQVARPSFFANAANVSPPAPVETTSAFLVEASLVADDHAEAVAYGPAEHVFMAEEVHEKSVSGLENVISFLRTSRGLLLCLGLSLLVAGVTVTGVLCSGGSCTSSPALGNQAVSTAPFGRPTVAPTVAPTSAPPPDKNLLIRAVLPNYTLMSLDDPFSPQSKAFSWLENHTFLESLTETRMEELFAMATFYFAFSGNTWAASGPTNYLSYSEAVCNWGEVAGCSDGSLQSLRLAGYNSSMTMKLRGKMPPEIAMLSSLQSIQIMYTDLQITLADMIPTEMGLMTSLEYLEFTSSVSGTIPSAIGLLTNLKALYVRQNSNLAGTLPTELVNLMVLDVLDLSKNQLTGTMPREMFLLTSLKELYLSDNLLAGPFPTEFGLLTTLIRLTLRANVNMFGTVPTELGRLTALEGLYLAGTQLNGTIPSEMALLTSLREAYWETNQLSGPLPTELGLLAKLDVLYLHSNQLNGTIPTTLGQMKTLRNLCLRYNRFSGPIPSQLGMLSNLKIIQLEYNSFSGVVPEEMCALPLSRFQLDCGDNATCPVGCGCLCCGIDDPCNMFWLR